MIKNTPPHTAASTDTPPQEKRANSAGEVIFNRVTYTGIGFGVNEGLSLWLTDEFEHGRGKPLFEKMSNWLVTHAPTMFKPKIVDGVVKTTAKQSAGNTLMMVGLVSGGTLLLAPMKWLEDHKSGWVKRFNHAIDLFKGNTITKEEQETRDAEVEQAIQEKPKQSWTSLIVGRAVGIGYAVGLGYFMGAARNEKLKDLSEVFLVGNLKRMNESGGSPNATIQRFTDSDKTKRYARLAGVETLSCSTTSIVLELTSKLFAKHTTVDAPKEEHPTDHWQSKVSARPIIAAKQPDKTFTERTSQPTETFSVSA